MPLVTKIGVYVIKPFGIGIFDAITISYAIFISSFITVLIYAFFQLFKKTYSFWIANFTSIIFVFFHFWIFRKYKTGNSYMLWTRDACTYYYYVIPNLLNVILVLWVAVKPEICDSLSNNDLKRKAVFLFVLYYSIFSNIWGSIIFAAYLSGKILIEILRMLKNGESFIASVKKHVSSLLILVLWLLSQLIELSGGRASVVQKTNYFTGIKSTLGFCYDTVKNISSSFLLFAVILIIGGCATAIAKNELASLGKKCLQYVWASVVIFMYLILTCAKVEPEYISRPDVYYGLFAFLCIIELICLAEILKHCKNIMVYMPLIISIIFFHIDTQGKTFVESTLLNEEPEIINDINNNIVDQFLKAEASGEKTLKLYVPKYESEDNWPYATYAGSRLSSFMYEYGITDRYIEVSEIIPVSK